jgi:ABC-type sugar transport system permease subunit
MTHLPIFATVTPSAIFACSTPPALYEWYDRALRAPLFTGSVALTGLLFTAMSFFVVNLKTGIYGEKAYRDKIREARQFNPSLEVFGPLRRFTKLTLWTILAAFVCAVLQMTVGLVPSNTSVAVCLTAAGIAAATFFFLLWIIAVNVNDLFADLEKDANNKIANGE